MVSRTFFLFLAITLLALPADPQRRGPARITWSVPEVSEKIVQGTKKEVAITLRSSSGELSNVTLWISPSLRGVLSVGPSGFDTLAANRDYKVVLTFTGSTPGEHGGTMHVKLGEATIPVPLTIGLRIIRR